MSRHEFHFKRDENDLLERHARLLTGLADVAGAANILRFCDEQHGGRVQHDLILSPVPADSRLSEIDSSTGGLSAYNEYGKLCISDALTDEGAVVEIALNTQAQPPRLHVIIHGNDERMAPFLDVATQIWSAHAGSVE